MAYSDKQEFSLVLGEGPSQPLKVFDSLNGNPGK